MTSYKSLPCKAILPLALLLPALPALADPGWDGIIGSEWNGIIPVQVAYDPLAPQGGLPGPANHQTGYEIFTRSDSNYVYVAIRTTNPGTGSIGSYAFSNLYFSMLYGPGPFGNASSRIGFEATNDRAFVPFLPGSYNDIPADLIRYGYNSGAAPSEVIETALDWSIFTNNALGVVGYGLPLGAVPVGLRLDATQSFGYSFVGGSSFGNTGLGFMTVSAPEPSTLSLLMIAGVGAGLLRRRRHIRESSSSAE